MKKRNILAAVFAAVLTMFIALSSTAAFAAGGKAITINGVKTGDSVKLCKIIDITKNDDNSLTKEFVTALKGENIDEFAKLSGDQLKEKIESLAAKVANDPAYTQTANKEGKVVFADVAPGQYIVLGVPSDTNKTYQVTTVTVDYEPNDSNGYELVVTPSDTFTIKMSDLDKPTKELVTTGGANVGDKLEYTISINVPTYPDVDPNDPTKIIHKTFIITDDMAKGKLVNPELISIKVGPETVPQAAYTTTYADGKFKIDFNYDELIKTASAGTTLKIQYKATVDHVDGTDGSLTNGATETINPNPYVETTYETEPSEVTTHTFGLVLKKVDATDNTLLKDAVFALYEDQGCTKPVVVDGKEVKIRTTDKGYAYQAGIKAGTYYLKEIEAPAGYRIDKTVKTVELGKTSATADNPATDGVVETNFNNIGDITNNKAPKLPVTGGPGTVALTCIGICLVGGSVIAAGKKNKQNK